MLCCCCCCCCLCRCCCRCCSCCCRGNSFFQIWSQSCTKLCFYSIAFKYSILSLRVCNMWKKCTEFATAMLDGKKWINMRWWDWLLDLIVLIFFTKFLLIVWPLYQSETGYYTKKSFLIRNISHGRRVCEIRAVFFNPVAAEPRCSSNSLLGFLKQL